MSKLKSRASNIQQLAPVKESHVHELGAPICLWANVQREWAELKFFFFLNISNIVSIKCQLSNGTDEEPKEENRTIFLQFRLTMRDLKLKQWRSVPIRLLETLISRRSVLLYSISWWPRCYALYHLPLEYSRRDDSPVETTRCFCTHRNRHSGTRICYVFAQHFPIYTAKFPRKAGSSFAIFYSLKGKQHLNYLIEQIDTFIAVFYCLA